VAGAEPQATIEMTTANDKKRCKSTFLCIQLLQKFI
jgi:hypothetical protein